MSSPLHERHRRLWEDFAKADPLYAILSDRDKQGGRWDAEQFFRSGEDLLGPELSEILGRYPPASRGRALDFGCGVGRLTRCLLPHFDDVVGLDVSSEMVELGQKLNPDADRLSLLAGSDPDLRALEGQSFDFVLSLITLQHIPRRFQMRYLRSLIRVTKAGGLLFLQLPSRPLFYRDKPLTHDNPTMAKREYRRLARALRSWWRGWRKQRGIRGEDGEPFFLMSYVPLTKMAKFLQKQRCQILRIRVDNSASEAYESFDYLIRKE